MADMALSLQDLIVQRRRLTSKLGVKLGPFEVSQASPQHRRTGVLRVTQGWVFKASKADEHIHPEVCALLKLLTPQSEVGVVRMWVKPRLRQ